MRQEVLDYLKNQRVGVLAVEMPDGSPHAATLHFAHSEESFVFYFLTHQETRKLQALKAHNITRASFVIGSDERNMQTLQLDGVAQLVEEREREAAKAVFLGKFAEKGEKSTEPDHVLFKFTPTWWRFTDWKTPQGKMIWTSDDTK